VDGLALDYPHLGKFAHAADDLAVHIGRNASSLINYGERYRAGERISSCLAESTVNAVISKRFARGQQMQWSSAAPTCSYRSGHAPSTARSGHCSNDGILAFSPTTTTPPPSRRPPRDTPPQEPYASGVRGHQTLRGTADECPVQPISALGKLRIA